MEKKKAIIRKVSLSILLCALAFGSWWMYREPLVPAETTSETHAPASLTANPAASPTADETDDSFGEKIEDIDRTVGTFGHYEMRLHRTIVDIGGNQPEVSSWYEVVDVPAKRAVKLAELFPESTVVAAVAKSIHDEVYPSDPDTAADFKRLKAATAMSEMKAILAKFPAELFFSSESCEETVDIDPKTDNFAVVGFDPASGKTDIHLGIFAQAHNCKSGFPRLRLQLETPADLRADLEAAAAKKRGFLPTVDLLRVCENCDPIDVAKLELSGP